MSTLASESLADKDLVLEPLTMQIVVRRDLLDVRRGISTCFTSINVKVLKRRQKDGELVHC